MTENQTDTETPSADTSPDTPSAAPAAKPRRPRSSAATTSGKSKTSGRATATDAPVSPTENTEQSTTKKVTSPKVAASKTTASDATAPKTTTTKAAGKKTATTTATEPAMSPTTQERTSTRRSPGVALDTDDDRFAGPSPDGGRTTSRGVSAMVKPWESRSNEPTKQVNFRLAEGLKDRVTGILDYLETQEDDVLNESASVRDVYGQQDALNMAVLEWVQRVEEQFNNARQFRPRTRARRRNG